MTLRARSATAPSRASSLRCSPFGAWLPEAHIDGVARALAWLAWALSPSLRAVGMHTLAQGLPERRAEAPTGAARLGRAPLPQRAPVPARRRGPRRARRRRRKIPPSTREILRPSPRGTVVATGHLGNWELLGSALASLGHETFAVVRRTRNAAVADRVTALRRALGFAEIPRGPYSALQCVRALRRGALVGLLCDQASDQASADVAFLGRPAATALGPATLARRTGARLVFAQLRPLADGRHRLECAEIQVFPDDLETLRAINDPALGRHHRRPAGVGVVPRSLA